MEVDAAIQDERAVNLSSHRRPSRSEPRLPDAQDAEVREQVDAVPRADGCGVFARRGEAEGVPAVDRRVAVLGTK